MLRRLVATCISDNCLHMLFKPAMAMEFAEVCTHFLAALTLYNHAFWQLLDHMFSASKGMAEKESSARFYLACAVLALEYVLA